MRSRLWMETVCVGRPCCLPGQRRMQPRPTCPSADALKFPFVAGAGLAVLFVAFKYLDTLWVNRLLLVYFVVLGIPSVATLLGPLLKLALPSDRVVVNANLPVLGPVRWTAADLASLALGAAVAGAYAGTKHWLLNNALGVAFTVEGIRQISLGTYTNGALLLAGLFVCEFYLLLALLHYCGFTHSVHPQTTL